MGLSHMSVPSDNVKEIEANLALGGFKKKRNYWYKYGSNVIFCVNIQHSQWDPNDYYINIGAKDEEKAMTCPTQLHWTWRHRIFDEDGNQVNIAPLVVAQVISDYFSDYLT